ncbi:hypothetical protein MTO96_032515 [Rhipicephalus appendiculatus]
MQDAQEELIEDDEVEGPDTKRRTATTLTKAVRLKRTRAAIRDARLEALEARSSSLEETITATITRTIQQSLVRVMVRVMVVRGVQRRHVDQVRPRNSSTPFKKEPCETPIAKEHSSPEIPLSSSGIQSTSSAAVQAGLAVPGEKASGGGVEPASPRSTAEPILVRRSTCACKPPDRF